MNYFLNPKKLGFPKKEVVTAYYKLVPAAPAASTAMLPSSSPSSSPVGQKWGQMRDQNEAVRGMLLATARALKSSLRAKTGGKKPEIRPKTTPAVRALRLQPQPVGPPSSTSSGSVPSGRACGKTWKHNALC